MSRGDRGARAWGEPVLVFTAPSLVEAQVARARLEAEGIPVLLKGEGEGPYRVGPMQLWVPSELEVQARLVLEGLGGEAREGQ